MKEKMIIKTFLFCLAFALSSHFAWAGVWDNVNRYFTGENNQKPPTIRVLVIHDVESVNLQVKGRYSLFDPYTHAHLSSRFAGKSRAIQAAGGGLKWGESFPGLYQLKIHPKDKATTYSINERDYQGTLFVYDIGGTVSIVDETLIEDYVTAILASYKGEGLEKEVLAALAIVARTNAYYQSANPKNPYWAVDGQKVGFYGLSQSSSATDSAVKETRYMIMSKTGIYDKVATPFAVQFGNLPSGLSPKEGESAKITLEQANEMARNGEHAAQILTKAFPGSNIMLMKFTQ